VEVSRLLKAGFDVNWKSRLVPTPLFAACDRDQSAVVKWLLAHPDVNVNEGRFDGATPFYGACKRGSMRSLRLLLGDSRVTPNQRNNDGYSPLVAASEGGFIEVIKLWIASRRDISLGAGDSFRTDAISVAKNLKPAFFEDETHFNQRKKGAAQVVSLLESFDANPALTCDEVRKELGITGNMPHLVLFSLSITSFCEG